MKNVIRALLALAFLCTSDAFATISFVSAVAVDDGGSDGTTLTATLTVTAGNTIYIFSKFDNPCSAATTTFSDNAGTPNTYTQIDSSVTDAGGFTCSSHFRAAITTTQSSATITMTTSATTHSRGFSLLQFSGLAATGYLDAHPAIATADSALTLTPASFNTSSANEVVVSGGGSNTINHTWTADATHCQGGAFTLPAAAVGTNKETSAQYCILNATQTGQVATTTIDSNTASLSAGVVSFSATSGGTTRVVHRVINN